MHQYQMTQTSSARRFGWLAQPAAAHCSSLHCPKPWTGRRARPSWDRLPETKQDSAAHQAEEPSSGCSAPKLDFQASLLALEFWELAIVDSQLELLISKIQKLLEQQMTDSDLAPLTSLVNYYSITSNTSVSVIFSGASGCFSGAFSLGVSDRLSLRPDISYITDFEQLEGTN